MSKLECTYSCALLALLAACGDDQPGPGGLAKIRVTPTSGLVTREAGDTVEFTVALTEAPSAPVSLRVFSDDESEGRVDVSELVFTRYDWGPRPVRVQGMDDAEQDGNALYHVVIDEAVSDDLRFQSVAAADVTLTNLDDDAPGVTVSHDEGLYTSERGDIAVLSVRLNSRPTAAVIVPVSSSKPGEGQVSEQLLTFYPRTWDVVQDVIVTGLDDDSSDGNVPYFARFAPVQSSDIGYLGLDPEDVEILSLDDESSNVSVSWVDDGPLREGDGSTRDIEVRLLSAPTADVEISAWSSLEGVEANATLRFTVDDWQSAQWLSISAADNSLLHDQVASIEFSVTSSDPAFAGAYIAPLELLVEDDDVGKLSLSSTSEQTCERAVSECCTTVFIDTSNPFSGQLTVGIYIDSSSATTANTTLSLVEGGANSFEVCGVDDGFRTGDTSYEVEVSVQAADDPFFMDTLPAVLTLTAVDDGTSPDDWTDP